MKKKKLSILLLAVLAVGSLASCGKNPDPSSEVPPSSEKTSEKPSEITSEKPSEDSSEKPSVIEPIRVTSISLSVEKTALDVEQVTSYVVNVLPVDADDLSYIIHVENDKVLELDESAKTIKALAAGNSKVIATSTDGGFSDEVSITVTETRPPVLKIEGEKELSVAAGENLTLPVVSATDRDGTDLTSAIEVEDLAEPGTIVGNVFNAKIAGLHILSYYVETADGRYAEDEVKVNVVPAHPETFVTEGYTDPSVITTYGTFKENFAEGRRSPFYTLTDGNNASSLTGLSDAIEGNSLRIDANKTAGSAINAIFLNAFNEHFERGKAVTYYVSFDYKIITSSGGSNLKDFYVGLSWDGFDGLNNAFVKSSDEQGVVYHYEATFPAVTVPVAGNAYFRFFKLSGSSAEAVIVVDSFTIKTIETAQVTKVVPTANQLLAEGGFTWDWNENGSAATNSETVIIANLENEAARTEMEAASKFGVNALKLTNADSHVFEGLTKDNMVVGKKLVVDFDFYAVNGKGFVLIMMGEGGNPTLSADVTKTGNISHVHLEVTVLSGFYALNIYGAGNPAFEIYLSEMTAKLVEADPIPEDTTPNGHKVGDSWTITNRQWGNEVKAGVKTEAFDGYAPAIAEPKMGSAPTKFTWSGENTNMEWFQGSGRIENGAKYEITAVYYVESWTEGTRFMYNFDNNVFLDAGPTTAGFHESTITWEANRNVDFFSIYVPEANTGVLYLASITVTLIAL
mgnify:CR=1 FL=1